jgi:putative hemolysin
VLLLLIGILLFVNALFVLSEMALVSARKARLQSQAEKGDVRAAAALRLMEHPTRFLSTVQIGITLISIVLGALGEDAMADRLSKWIGTEYPALAHYSHAIAFGVTIAVIAYLSLVVAELVPKRLGQSHPETIAKLVAGPMTLISRITSPLVMLLSISTDVLLRFIPEAPAASEQAAQEEVKAILAEGTQEGVFKPSEQKLVGRVFRLSEQRIKALMVPRNDIDFLHVDDTIQRIRVAVATSSHSQFPVCANTLDELVGFVHVKDLVKHGLISDELNLRELIKPPMFVPENSPALKVLETLRSSGVHMAFVVDEYGVLVGLVTLNDLLVALLGEVDTPQQSDDPMVVKRADGSYLLDGMLSVADLRELLTVTELPKQDIADFDTLGGFVMSYLGRIPHTGDTFAFERFEFEVVDMDRTRVDKVLLNIKPKPTEDAQSADPGI